MTTSKLTLYNGALRLCGERKLLTLSEDRAPRRYLDDAWDDGAVIACLEEGFWNFATRSVRIDASTSVEPDFGYQYAFDKPSDYVRTAAVCTDEFFKCPLLEYSDEVTYWFADNDTIYVQYISSDTSYGFNYAAWPQTFVKFVEAYLADQIKGNIGCNGEREQKIEKTLKTARINARSKDAMNQPQRTSPRGSWVAARTTSRVTNNSGNSSS